MQINGCAQRGMTDFYVFGHGLENANDGNKFFVFSFGIQRWQSIFNLSKF